MKKLILFISLLFISCLHENKNEYSFEKFDKPIYDTIKPKTNIKYTTQSIKVKGYVEDTIYVSFGRERIFTKFYLTKEIDTIINSDYYGAHDAIFVFDPRKCKNGKIKLTFSIF